VRRRGSPENSFCGRVPTCFAARVWVSVADAVELAVELGGGIVWVALVVVFGRFGLTLFEGVDEIGLGDGLETEKRNAERGGGGVKAEVFLMWWGKDSGAARARVARSDVSRKKA
jgi:hypothetical protein